MSSGASQWLGVLLAAVGCTRLKPDSPLPADSLSDASEDASLDASQIASPVDGCDSCDGGLRCSPTGKLELCTLVQGCMVWSEGRACDEGAMCCGSACIAIDDSNCFACGRACAGDTPVCKPELKGCGCTPARCLAQGLYCDPEGTACVAPPFGDHVLFVDASVVDAGQGDGTLANPYRTITRALERAAADRAGINAAMPMPTKIAVASGTYDRQLGETFPMMIQGGIWLQGSGPEATIIEGTDENVPRSTGSTVIVDDDAQINRMTGFTLKPKPNLLPGTTVGVLCLSGNATADGKTNANTELSDLVVVSAYATGIEAAASQTAKQPGCNVSVTKSVIQAGGTGLLARGCIDAVDHGPIAVEVGDGTDEGANSFLSSGVSILIKSCVAGGKIRNNKFKAATGVRIEQPMRLSNATGRFEIQRNHFVQMTRTGVNLVGGSVVVDDFSDNELSDVTAPAGSGFVGTALLLEGLSEAGFARIVKARRNRFVGNDIGIKFLSTYPYRATFGVSDFGTSTNLGANTIRCNSQILGSLIDGGDVVVDLNVTDTITLPFAGNTWDHGVPSHLVLSSRQNGTDYTVRDLGDLGPKIILDISHASDPVESCQLPRVP